MLCSFSGVHSVLLFFNCHIFHRHQWVCESARHLLSRNLSESGWIFQMYLSSWLWGAEWPVYRWDTHRYGERHTWIQIKCSTKPHTHIYIAFLLTFLPPSCPLLLSLPRYQRVWGGAQHLPVWHLHQHTLMSAGYTRKSHHFWDELEKNSTGFSLNTMKLFGNEATDVKLLSRSLNSMKDADTSWTG